MFLLLNKLYNIENYYVKKKLEDNFKLCYNYIVCEAEASFANARHFSIVHLYSENKDAFLMLIFTDKQ